MEGLTCPALAHLPREFPILASAQWGPFGGQPIAGLPARGWSQKILRPRFEFHVFPRSQVAENVSIKIGRLFIPTADGFFFMFLSSLKSW